MLVIANEIEDVHQQVLKYIPDYVTETVNSAVNVEVMPELWNAEELNAALEELSGCVSGGVLELNAAAIGNGMEIGEEKDLDLTFPENYGNADLAGVDVTFVVTLDRIFVEEAAELNDEWVAAQGITDVSTVDEYRERVHQMYLEADELRYDGDISNKVFNHVIENSKYKGDYSELKQRYFDTMLKNDANQAAYYGEELGTFIMLYYGMTVEDYIDNMKTSAELTAKQAMVVEQIAAAEGIEVRL